jgi:La domain
MSPSAEERPNFLKESNVDGAPMPFSKATDDSNENSHHLQQEGLHLHRVNVLLARQLEYYFSTANLAKDTYLSTLRSLNDGYVPVSIIANFGKVQALAPLDSAFAAVKIAATDFSDLLEVVVVNSDTGKRVLNHDEKPSKTVLAVGPVSGEPIPMNKFYSCALSDAESVSSQEKDEHVVTPATSKSLATSFSSASGRGSNGVQNTIILRETPDGMTEEVVRELFAFEGCPAIESLHLDLQNCW